MEFNDSIQFLTEQYTESTNSNTIRMSIIVAIALLLITIVIYLIYKGTKKSSIRNTKSKILNEGTIDFNNVIDSSFKAKALYDKLKRVCHPDKFAKNDILTQKATEIFSLMVRNKHNYSELLKLKEIAEKELNINIKED